jgi:hypothetical protein
LAPALPTANAGNDDPDRGSIFPRLAAEKGELLDTNDKINAA